MERDRLRTMFEKVPELYDRARPIYPAQVFDDLVALAQLRAGARVVEIGCGTGQATLPLAERGFEVVCIELGEQLAAVSRRKLGAFPAVEIINASFETWEPATRPSMQSSPLPHSTGLTQGCATRNLPCCSAKLARSLL